MLLLHLLLHLLLLLLHLLLHLLLLLLLLQLLPLLHLHLGRPISASCVAGRRRPLAHHLHLRGLNGHLLL